MPFNFPKNPVRGDVVTVGYQQWKYNGSVWNKIRPKVQGPAGPQGRAGQDGARGATGATGATGPVGDYVESFAGFTGVVASGVAANEIVYHDGSSINGSSNFTFNGTDVDFTTDGVINTNDGGLLGKIVKDIKATEPLSAKDPVYISGSVGASGRVEVARADASDPAKMPAAGIVFSDFTTNQEGVMTVLGTVRKVDTTGFAVNQTAYVASGGGITSARPTGASDLIQNIGRAGRIHASTGTFIVAGAGRVNDVPNVVEARLGISLDAGGITFADGTHLASEGQIAFKNESNTFTQNNTFSANQIFSNGTGIGTDSSTPSIRFNSNNIVTLGDPEEGSNGVKLTVSDSAQLVTVSDANFKASQSIQVGTSIFHDGDADTILTFGNNTIDFDAGGREGMKLTATETQFNNGISVTGISGPSGITFSNGEVIRNNPDGSIQIIPSDEGGNHFGIEIDATEWGFGPIITAIEEDGSQVDNAIRFDSDIVLGSDASGSLVRFMFNSGADRGMQQNNNGDGTIGMGVNGDNGHFAVIRKADLADGDRSMSTSDKTALGMNNPQFLVYSADHTDANDYIRLEHDQTDANIFSGTGNINLAPAGGVVGISGGTLEANNFVVDGGKIFQKGNEATTNIDMSSAQDMTIRAADDITLNAGDDIFLTAADKVRISHGGAAGDGIIITAQGNSKFQMDGAGTFLKAADDLTFVTIGDVDELNSSAKINITDLSITVTEPNGSVAETFDSNYRRNTDVATFTIDASSSIATGTKTNALYRIPYNATLTKFDVKTNATGGLTAAIIISGSDFGNPTTSSATGCSLGIEGLTGSSTVFNTASVDAGDFIFLHITSNNSGASAAQAFLTYETR